jgi:hypothetical protein
LSATPTGKVDGMRSMRLVEIRRPTALDDSMQRDRPFAGKRSCGVTGCPGQ